MGFLQSGMKITNIRGSCEPGGIMRAFIRGFLEIWGCFTSQNLETKSGVGCPPNVFAVHGCLFSGRHWTFFDPFEFSNKSTGEREIKD